MMRCAGGPWDGQDVESTADILELDESETHAYHRTRPTDTDWRVEYDPEWFIKNLPEPVPPEHVYEWHERGWESPEVRSIKDAVREASER